MKNNTIIRKYYKKGAIILLIFIFLLWWWVQLPDPLFDVSYSTVVYDGDNQIIGMTVAGDEQYRFPEMDSLPEKYKQAVILFEDKRFRYHPGVDPMAISRAIRQNLKAGKTVSGGSTLTMQLVRLARNNPPRTIVEKFYEILLAVRLEIRYSKEEILRMYASHAPFGGNIVGMQAASVKYFDRLPEELSWGEAALLAVLPNAPSLKNKELLLKKRDGLIDRLYLEGYLSKEDHTLAKSEPLPRGFKENTHLTPHLLGRAFTERRGSSCRTYIDNRLQQRVNEIVNRHTYALSSNYIFNVAALVAHIPSGEVRAYVGNSKPLPGSRGNDVDIITSVRSSGSILKPALYALMNQSGHILPDMLIPDIPSRFGGYTPSNFNRNFLGAVPASRALSMSLNIPFVRMLHNYSYQRFYDDLKMLGITSLDRPADHYGLSLILGGAETSLWDICNLYAGMVSVLRHYESYDGDYFPGEYQRLKLWNTGSVSEPPRKMTAGSVPLEAAAIWKTLEAMKEVERPEMESGWKKFASRIDLAWKTGTSFGFRDGWAVGVNADWVIGVWVGNADGEGRPGLTGVRTAAPVLFEIAALLPVTGQLYEPTDELMAVEVCRKSGYRASPICEDRDTVMVCKRGNDDPLCPYHRMINLDKTGKWRVTSECESVYDMRTVPWFILPPVQEWYYVRHFPGYKKLPAFRSDCIPQETEVMELIYPQRGTHVFIPVDFGGKKGRVVFELAHRFAGAEVFWHVDDVYVGMTTGIHQLELDIAEGWHTLNLVDKDGNILIRRFRVVGK